MIKTATTFVVGAGGSRSYGIPMASELRVAATKLQARDVSYQLILCQKVEADLLRDVLNDLRSHPADSIDAFLESRSDEKTHYVGKALIATLLGEPLLTTSERGSDQEDDWLGYLIEQMRQGARDFEQFVAGNKNVRIVTFNFDSIIERRLVHDLTRAYRISEAQVSAFADEIVLHVHGRFGQLPPVKSFGFDTVRGPDKRVLAWLTDSIANIHVITDSIKPEILEAARTAISEAAVVCFLGFSFHPDNLRRLSVPDALKKDTFQHVYGSCFGLLSGEQARVTRKCAGQIRLAPLKCKEALRELDVFQD